MSSKYLPKQFESKWSELWDRENVYKTGTDPKKKKQYVLVMFPYPSGDGLHVGHARVYTGTDVLARYHRMKGMNVLHPMGWDAFGLPAENAAIKKKVNPMDIVPKNIQTFKKQMKMLGFSYDWDKELATTDPNYYRFTQWLFIQFFKMGLLYKRNAPIHFCPKCKTGLAEEEVLPNGTHERCGEVIEKRELPQWMFRITAYADRLLKDLDGLDWPKGILEMQRNWIGRSEGVQIEFKNQELNIKISVFTTAIDTVYGVNFIVIAPEHPLVKEILEKKYNLNKENIMNIKDYVLKAQNKTDLEREFLNKQKTGVFTGLYCLHPLNNKKIPIWIADYVLMGYGTGAVMGVPGHDARDYEFAKKYNISIIPVIKPKNEKKYKNFKEDGFWDYEDIKKNTNDDSVLFNSDEFNGLSSKEAKFKIIEAIEKKQIGKKKITYHLRDWIFSRQRYWGEPIPMIYCEKCAINQKSFFHIESNLQCKSHPEFISGSHEMLNRVQHDDNIVQDDNSLAGWFPMREEDLPLELPYVKSYEPTGTGESPLADIKSFVNTKCPNCGGSAKRETDTMPNWAGSCWYFLAFAFANASILNIKNKKSNFSENWKLEFGNFMNKFLPVDWYIGGAEHAVLHLLYSRFWVKALEDLGLVDFPEPFLRLRNVGMVLAEDHKKMSKSLGNVINPDDVVSEYGADSLRIYEMFMAPFNAEIPWSTRTLQGAYRFVVKIWQIYHDSDKLTDDKKEESKELVVKLQKVIQKVGTDITDVKFNTCISSMMEFVNYWSDVIDSVSRQPQKSENKASFFGAPRREPPITSINNKLSKENAKKFLQILAPFAPFITEEIWRNVFHEKTSIHLSNWPEAEKSLIHEETVTIAVQVNGKVRGAITLSHGEKKDKDAVVKKALSVEKVKKYVGDKKYNAIYVEGRIVNIII